ncbi:sialate O-acetylesterase [Thalassoroseus pseudoceratinae]|uniref:sialate O-acetylesterase n=1 Tax=Thalassoroseus pseudoceratinae TaxID=2713176 RepID=UPI00141F4607|nr:sialate O-acetylesterase [Thalassoroseus pseudoceratinae]
MRTLTFAFALLMGAAMSFPSVLVAEVKLAAIFSNHMVLQRDKPVPVWGWADAGAKVTVAFGDQKKSVTADKTGKWTVKLDPLEATETPQTLQVGSNRHDRLVKVTDVLVGEVWLGSGQSNMAMTVSRALDFESEKANADYPQIRMFKESSGGAAKPQADAKGGWVICSPKSVGSFSATLYFFGRELHRKLDVPIGLINSSVGGTPIESWVAADAQANVAELKESHAAAVKAYESFDVAKAQAQYEKALAQWKTRATKAKADGKKVPRRPTNLAERHQRRSGPGGLFNGKIAPLIPYAIRGAIWYQGEANSHAEKGSLYQYQLPLLVEDWRERWGEEFPFAWVQLPNYERAGEGWMLVREGMLKSLRLPKTGMAITVDIGEANDIHPRNKQDVGRRLAFWALGDVYDFDIVTSGPVPSGHEIKNGEVIVSFRHVGDGLRAKSGELKGFVIAGTDGQWKPATAKIRDNVVVVSHPEISSPVAVRYAWKANPDGNLTNSAGLPASPFRISDDHAE